MPSQSLSIPSQTSVAGVHWQTLLVWPGMAAQVQPPRQSDTRVQVVVHTLLPLGMLPFLSGRQIPLGQS
jgi:hypothetical protein